MVDASLVLGLADQCWDVDATLSIVTDPGTYDRALGKRVGATVSDLAVRAKTTESVIWNGTTRVAGLVAFTSAPATHVDPGPGDRLTVRGKTWLITKSTPCPVGDVNIGWLFEAGAVGP